MTTMIINADLHLHSRYSRATSHRMTMEDLAVQASRKGIDLIGTGDCLHPSWLKEIKQCNSVDEGTWLCNDTYFILSAEIEGKKRVHHLLYFPDLSAVETFKNKARSKSKNVDTTGRPHIDMTGEELAGLAEDVSALIGPAHTFTPWTSLYANHNSLEECYGSLTDYVSFVELGLSANSDYADMIKELHRLTFLTNSDSHSPHPVRLAREFTRFEVHDITFEEIKHAFLRINGNRSVLNVGLPPEEGKYNESACGKCYTHYTYGQAKQKGWICGCGKPIKKGVKDRIIEMANFSQPRHPPHRPPYLQLIPLAEIITKAVGQRNPFTKTVTKRWNELVSFFGSEINVLLDVSIEDISAVTTPAITEAIQAFRDNKVIIHPGGGGRYGTIEFPQEKDALKVTLG
jgi:uncharacterized protein (TIGR00375 family)